MRNKIVIATKNLHKFSLITETLVALGLGEYAFLNMYDIAYSGEIEETGTIEERAKQKARAALEYLSGEQKQSIRAIIGIDDGIAIKGIVTANARELTEGIVKGIALEPGEKVTDVRAHYGIILPEEEAISCQTFIPCIYRGSNGDVPHEENAYSLMQVFSYEGSKKTIADSSPEEILKNNLHYCGQELEVVVKRIRMVSGVTMHKD